MLRSVAIGMVVLVAIIELAGPKLIASAKSYSDMTESFGGPYPAAHSDYLPFTLVPGLKVKRAGAMVETNALGYRGPYPTQVQKPPGVRRILLLGDSFTMGWGVSVEDSVSGQMQKRLNSNGHSNLIEVINAGYKDGYSPDAYHAFFAKEGLPLQPDAVVMIVYLANDLSDIASNIWEETNSDGAPTKLRTTRLYPDWQGRLLNPESLPWNYRVPGLAKSRTFNALANTYNSLFNLAWNMSKGKPNFGLVTEEEAWQRFEISAKSIAKLCIEKGIHFEVLAFTRLGIKSKDDVYYPVVKRVIEERLKLPFMALNDQLDVKHMIPGDGHTNAEGNRIIAEAAISLLPENLKGQ